MADLTATFTPLYRDVTRRLLGLEATVIANNSSWNKCTLAFPSTFSTGKVLRVHAQSTGAATLHVQALTEGIMVAVITKQAEYRSARFHFSPTCKISDNQWGITATFEAFQPLLSPLVHDLYLWLPPPDDNGAPTGDYYTTIDLLLPD